MAEAKPNIASLIDSAEQAHERIVITKDGEPAAILLGIQDFEDMNNLLEIYTDPALQKEILDDIAYSKAHPEEAVSAEELRRVLDQRWARENSGE